MAETTSGGVTIVVNDEKKPKDAGTDKAKNLTDAEIRDYIQGHYGYLVAYLDHKEIGPILIKAAKEGWNAARLQGAISKTKWWKNTAANARVWDAQEKTDPKTAERRIQNTMAQLFAQARNMGITADEKTLRKIARDSLRLGWTQQQVQAALGAQWSMKDDKIGGKVQIGTAGTTLDELRRLSQNYLVPISNATLEQWTQFVLKGEKKIEDFDAYVKQMAKNLYPQLSAALDAGNTVRSYLDPYLEMAARELERPVDSFDLLKDPKWLAMLTPAQTGKDGKQQPGGVMSMSDWQRWLRSQDEFKTTKQAVDMSARFSSGLGRIFGEDIFGGGERVA